MTVCPVLPPKVGALLLPLRELISGMEQRDRLPQIELAAADGTTALVLRHLLPLSGADRGRLIAFAALHGVQWWLQPSGPDSVHPLDESDALLAYRLPEFGIEMPFKPTDFTQVNPHINRILVDRAVRLLDPQPDERVIDWFCGLGNFSLPLATRSGQVVGIEGSSTLVERATANAIHNGLSEKAEFRVADLFEIDDHALRSIGAARRWLIDPPREGAFALCKAVADLAASRSERDRLALPLRIVYVSCNPATLARDAGLLVHQAGYRCSLAGVVNMFPHTAHVESMAVFDRT
jgi:23S rRNA (uracil1939-C5)-methyltransferase